MHIVNNLLASLARNPDLLPALTPCMVSISLAARALIVRTIPVCLHQNLPKPLPAQEHSTPPLPIVGMRLHMYLQSGVEGGK